MPTTAPQSRHPLIAASLVTPVEGRQRHKSSPDTAIATSFYGTFFRAKGIDLFDGRRRSALASVAAFSDRAKLLSVSCRIHTRADNRQMRRIS
jgi:hypothetical protein